MSHAIWYHCPKMPSPRNLWSRERLDASNLQNSESSKPDHANSDMYAFTFHDPFYFSRRMGSVEVLVHTLCVYGPVRVWRLYTSHTGTVRAPYRKRGASVWDSACILRAFEGSAWIQGRSHAECHRHTAESCITTENHNASRAKHGYLRSYGARDGMWQALLKHAYIIYVLATLYTFESPMDFIFTLKISPWNVLSVDISGYYQTNLSCQRFSPWIDHSKGNCPAVWFICLC